MTDTRSRILERIHGALQTESISVDFDTAFSVLAAARAELAQPELADDIVNVFSREAVAVAVDVHHLAESDMLPQWVLNRAAQLDVRPPLVLSPGFDSTDSSWAPLAVIEDSIQTLGCWGIVRGFAGIAETGTVVSLSHDCPSGLLFLVERLVVVLNRRDIVAYQEDVWHRLRKHCSGTIPRTVNLITGPSRTADVAQQIQIGAHGPKWVDYLIVG